MAVGQNYYDPSNDSDGGESHADKEKIEKVVKMYEQYIKEHGLYFLGGIIDIRKLPRTVRINNEEYWTIEKVNEDQDNEVPESTYAKYMCAKEAGLPCLSLVWAEQHVEEHVEPKTQKPKERRREPAGVTVGAMFAELLFNFAIDPMLVWVLPVSDFEGVGVVLGCWNH